MTPRRRTFPVGLAALAVTTVVACGWASAAWHLYSPSVGLLTGGVLAVQGAVISLAAHWREVRRQRRASVRRARWAQTPVEPTDPWWDVPDRLPPSW